MLSLGISTQNELACTLPTSHKKKLYSPNVKRQYENSKYLNRVSVDCGKSLNLQQGEQRELIPNALNKNFHAKKKKKKKKN